MVNNFQIIAENILKFESSREFYFLQIIRRAKDNLYFGSNNQFVKAYSVYSVEDFWDKQARIIDLCDLLNARAYVHPAPRDDRVISLMMMEELAKCIREEQYPNARNLWASMCGRYNPHKGKKSWIIDIDSDILPVNFHNTFDQILPIGDKIKCTIPTKNGLHYITTPFDLKTFNHQFPSIDVHRNNPTLLYCQ